MYLSKSSASKKCDRLQGHIWHRDYAGAVCASIKSALNQWPPKRRAILTHPYMRAITSEQKASPDEKKKETTGYDTINRPKQEQPNNQTTKQPNNQKPAFLAGFLDLISDSVWGALGKLPPLDPPLDPPLPSLPRLPRLAGHLRGAAAVAPQPRGRRQQLPAVAADLRVRGGHGVRQQMAPDVGWVGRSVGAPDLVDVGSRGEKKYLKTLAVQWIWISTTKPQ